MKPRTLSEPVQRHALRTDHALEKDGSEWQIVDTQMVGVASGLAQLETQRAIRPTLQKKCQAECVREMT